ncbi:hypothetical protein [Botryobacter ruber]|uniref:hypothetical protein n=1 Tax=Botryobacter ruber TaxID=2171629 RepID=UPI000E0AF27E|nr:hypothetical protein [Botryobacter ruber]
MQAFLLIDLSNAAGAVYEQPLLAHVKKTFPGISTFDLDAQSDTMLQQYAVRLLQEADKAAVCIRADEDAAGFGTIMPVLEELLTPHPDRLLLLYGINQRLQRMLQARPLLAFSVVNDEQTVYRQLQRYFA